MKGIRTTISTAACLVGLALIFTASPATADQVILDDVIIDGSLCVGFDCVNGESFGFDTIRLKENNLRIHFLDTSTAASFPDRDWKIVANDSANGGSEYLGFEDVNGGTFPFRVFGGARNNALVVDSQGDIGIGTSTPSVDIHVKTGDTPTLRLEQDGTSGFQPQTWDVAGNETNFFIRDVTNGSKLPIRSRPDAPTSSIDVASDGDVGMGTSSPGQALHINRNTTGNVAVRIENDNADWDVRVNTVGAFALTAAGSGVNEFELTETTGDLTIIGSINTTDCSPCVSDYVFEDDYELMPLTELAQFIEREGHLPNVPSQGDVDKAGKLNMTQMQMRMLEKIEELVLYTLEQQSTIDALQTRLDTLEQQPE